MRHGLRHGYLLHGSYVKIKACALGFGRNGPELIHYRVRPEWPRASPSAFRVKPEWPRASPSHGAAEGAWPKLRWPKQATPRSAAHSAYTQPIYIQLGHPLLSAYIGIQRGTLLDDPAARSLIDGEGSATAIARASYGYGYCRDTYS